MPKRRLLVAVYDYPPSTSVGGTRWLTMKKYLERLGYDVSILTTNAYGRLPTDEAEQVIRAPDLVASTRLRRALGRPSLPRPGQEVSVDTAPPAVLTKVFIPDIYAVSWVPSAARVMRRIVRERSIDVLISTSPKDSTHLVGLAALEPRPAWVADFRDGWVFESTRPPLPTRIQQALDRKLEARVVRKADAIVAFSEVLAADFQRRFGREARYVSNGWDPELEVAAELPAVEHLLGPKRQASVRLVYTGTLTGAEGAPTDRSPLPLLEALERLAVEDGELASRIELVLLGRQTQRDEALLARFERLGLIKHLGYVPRATSLSVQRSADVLVLVSGATPSSIPLKLFEYLGARRPILHLGQEGAAQRILDETGAGVTVPLDDGDGIVAQLRLIAGSRFAQPYSPHGIDRYTYPFVAEQMAEAIEEAVAKRTSSGGR
jgi:glycosyltransferase involved in cell wall biosynthesis